MSLIMVLLKFKPVEDVEEFVAIAHGDCGLIDCTCRTSSSLSAACDCHCLQRNSHVPEQNSAILRMPNISITQDSHMLKMARSP